MIINYLFLFLQKNNMSNFKTILISFFVGAVAYAIFGKKIAEMLTKNKKKSEDIIEEEETKSTIEK